MKSLIVLIPWTFRYFLFFIFTGAGVSVSCGIPDFRSRDGVYARLAVDFPDLPDPQAMFDIHYFRRDPRPFFKFAREIYPGQFKPSPCHKFIRSVEKHGKLLKNYTQNIDTLEQVKAVKSQNVFSIVVKKMNKNDTNILESPLKVRKYLFSYEGGTNLKITFEI